MVKDVLTPAAPESVKIGGRLGAKLDLCVEHRILAQDVRLLIAPFGLRRKRAVRIGAVRPGGNGSPRSRLPMRLTTPITRVMCEEAAKALIATAAADGYIGTRAPQHRLQGWDVWGCKYVLIGLIAYYDRTHDKEALGAARRHADVLSPNLVRAKPTLRMSASITDWRHRLSWNRWCCFTNGRDRKNTWILPNTSSLARACPPNDFRRA